MPTRTLQDPPLPAPTVVRTVQALRDWLADQPADRPVVVGWGWRAPSLTVAQYLHAEVSPRVVVIDNSGVD